MKYWKFLCLILLWSALGIAQDKAPVFKDQKKSLIPWGELNVDNFLSLKKWKDQSDDRDLVPEWETIVKERNNREMVGRFLQCVGHCRVDRGESFFKPSFRSAVFEGDEVQTIGESYAWIFLFDGTMVRLSPESSINFNELNIGKKENFINARINMGNILWLSRNSATFSENNIRETDILFFPLDFYEAMPVTDKSPYAEDKLIELLEEPQTVMNQYKRLNSLIEENNKITKEKPTYVFLVSPNVTLMGYAPSLEIISLLGGKTYFKKRSQKFLDLTGEAVEEDTFVQMRGFENNTLTPLETDRWLVVDEKGRSLTTSDEHSYWLTMGEFITKRIPSIMVARELMLKNYSAFAFRNPMDPEILARNDGYRLWGVLQGGDKKEDLEQRLDFLKEYFRRVETTNLLVAGRFRERLKERGESLKTMEYGNYFFIKALNEYYSYPSKIHSEEAEKGIDLNSTKKTLWKRMHGIK